MFLPLEVLVEILKTVQAAFDNLAAGAWQLGIREKLSRSIRKMAS
jgi:hypothetical protein